MPYTVPSSAPATHRQFVARALPILQADPRLAGVAAAGSWADDSMDAYSDVDLVIAVQPSAFDDVVADRTRIACALGNLVASFTGEHVGEPRVLICLYADPLLHVDLKFVRIDGIGPTVDRPVVLWERAPLGDALARAFTGYPKPDAPWLEQRFWTWIHYGAAKVLRGELYEAIDLIAFLRGRVLGPLILERVGEKPAGVRRLEKAAPAWASRLAGTVPRYAPESCLDALNLCAELYRELLPPARVTPMAEHAAMRFLRDAAGALESTSEALLLSQSAPTT